ncbi:protogenin B-like isoform X2 [Physella acuta]|uniref:protogenin B-like isoform X2 n=1 Tax=Physella acuta TaxID=109671 RepID=UPI0027DCFB03|nr:protogenin B-like isoform X2 [Physella acuta]
MASALLYLGFLFAITLTCIRAKETEVYDTKINSGLSLIPDDHIISVLDSTKPVLINCSVSVNNPKLLPLRYHWYLNGSEIASTRKKPRKGNNRKLPQKGSKKFKLHNNGSLELKPRQRAKSRNTNRRSEYDGVYECFVNTSSGDVLLARRVKVVTPVIAENFTKEPSTVEAYEGGVVRFECNIWSDPAAFYIWHKNDKEVTSTGRFTVFPSGALQITDVELSDRDVYWCQAAPYVYTVNGMIANFEWKKSKKAELKVKSDSTFRPLTLLASPQNVSVIVEKTAYFECLADGNQKPVVEWKKRLKDGSTVVMSSEYRYGQSNLRITKVKPEHAGIYECKISDGAHSIIKTASLEVLVPPKLEEGLSSYKWPVAKTSTMQCKVSGIPAPNITWYFNGTPIENRSDLFPKDNADKSTLRLYTLRKEHSGYYVCVADNGVGQVMTLAYILIQKNDNAAETARNVSATALNSTAIRICWQQDATYNVPPVIHHQERDNPNPPTQTLCFTANEKSPHCDIGSLTPNTNYWFTVHLFKESGAGEMSERVTAWTLEEKPLTVPSLTVASSRSHDILVSWTPLTPAQCRGNLTRYQVYYQVVGSQDERSKVVPADKTSFLIDNLLPDTEYNLVVVACNNAGCPTREKWRWLSSFTAPADSVGAGLLNIMYINNSAVLLDWQSLALHNTPEVGYDLELSDTETKMNISLPASAQSHVITDLDYRRMYNITLISKYETGSPSAVSQNFRLEDLASRMPPANFHSTYISSNSISFEWQPVPGTGVQYEICYKPELDKLTFICQSSQETTATISDLKPLKRYEFKVCAFTPETKGRYSDLLIVQTIEARPSAPQNLTSKVQGTSVFLHWLPPVQPNGDIMSYKISYCKNSDCLSDSLWKEFSLNDLTTQVNDLDYGQYWFKVCAVNNDGPGAATVALKVEIKCDHCATEEPVTKNPSTSKIGIIVGVGLGAAILIILILLAIMLRRSYLSRAQDQSTNHSPIYRGGNGHIPSPANQIGQHKPGNGHTHIIGKTPDDHEVITLLESTPMLHKIPENDHCDSKGGPDLIIPNGFRSNGIVKLNHKLPTQVSYSSGDLNTSNNSEELQGLMAATLASTDGSDTLVSSVEMIPMSSMDDIDQGDDDRSSEDSGTGCRRAGMHCNELDPHCSSPAGSPVEQHKCWEHGRQVDEIGGVFTDRSTGAVIGEVSRSNKDSDQQGDAAGEGYEDCLATDRDSGHGSEVKSHGGLASTSLGLNFEVHASSLGSEEQLLGVNSTDLLPQSSSPSPSSSESPTASPQQQQPSSMSLSNDNQHNHPQHTASQHISHSDLPPPPPPPLPTLPLPQGSSAAITATSTAASATAELNSSGSNSQGGQGSNGSMFSRQSEGETIVAFSPGLPPSQHPYIA